MRLRAGPGFGSVPIERTRAAIDAGLRRFEAAVAAENAQAARGLARAMQGFLRWDADNTAEGRAQAAGLFADARARMPEYAAARNLAAVTRPLLPGEAFDARSLARLGRELTGALALDPGDGIVLGNLERVYRVYAAQPEWSPFGTESVAQRLAVVQATRARLPQGN